jgi:excisionase family DNA binding protein
MTPEKEQEDREEAERLAQMPRDDQRQLIAQHRAIAADKGVPMPDRKEAKERTEAALIDVQAVAALLSCSTRHVYRLVDAGRMPRPVKLGALVRWNRQSVMKWLAEGCPPIRR